MCVCVCVRGIFLVVISGARFGNSKQQSRTRNEAHTIAASHCPPYYVAMWFAVRTHSFGVQGPAARDFSQIRDILMYF